MTLESKKNWQLPENISIEELEKYKSLSPKIASLLHSRGIAAEDSERFLKPTLDQVPDFTHLYNADKAAKQIVEAVKAGRKIYIHGDFDADGICATSILWEFIYREMPKAIGKEVDVMPYIPDRATEGYGLSEPSVEAMIDGGAKLIITVDCGVRDKKLIQEIQKKHGVEFIVTDHHQPPDDLAKKLDYTVVHQMYPDHHYPELQICGSVVALLLIQAIRAELALPYEFNEDTPGLDLAGMATVTDMMPLTGVNRVLVKAALDQIKKGKRVGLVQLCEIAKVDPKAIEAYHFGFVLGPRINASGRIGSAIEAVKLLVTENPVIARKNSASLNSLNYQRQQLTEEIMQAARLRIDTELKDDKLIFLDGENWPEGIIGLVAGKIQEAYGRPTVVVTVKDEEIKGSARSLKGFNITNAIEEFNELLERYGGHEQAAGFSVKVGKLEEFRQALVNYANEKIDPTALTSELKIDMIIDTEDMNVDTVNELAQLEPFGYGNRKPVVMLQGVVVFEKFVMGRGGNHLRLKLKGDGIGFGTAVMFDCAEDIEKIEVDDLLDIAGTLGINEWNGNVDVQFLVKEWRKP
ncbi:MAG: single-stranded-DNA-specific exonuclease RecJ [Candidatus Dojkabacteria bacterium]|nr:MAG: single-stranded-DNA-specific exonuclease RecJ [Candidatus Dojkabacteria bacterium]